MSQRGADFLLGWLETNIQPVPGPPPLDKTAARQKAEECLAAAEASGVSRAEIEAEVGGLVDYLHSAMVIPDESAAVHIAEGDVVPRPTKH